ncbi:methyltransferase domain-containing protein [Kaistella faecalis]|uniref:methyltransferase domain-containing protein n=1 Tax=Kaistella faecalis TaxID=2852098 RepID=UPI001C458683|nr:methyltransferase domain-containing protein [Chryseobacterium faecale]UFK97427.1 class I SAM-dependent methyltransferase [Chryseobacterium faecale]
MRIITTEDFSDIYIKIHQRGLPFVLSKFNINAFKRTQSAFNNGNLKTANFWIIPDVRKRWNRLITGDENQLYEDYLTKNYFKDKTNLKLISLGSGVCSHEIRLAELRPDWEVHCYDFSDKLLQNAAKSAQEKKLNNISFFAENVITYNFEPQRYDIVFFHASLHHFDKMDDFLKNVAVKNLKPGGYLIINEFVGNNRLQYSQEQINYINKAIDLIPKKFRKIFKTGLYKNSYSGSGVLRMIAADPSECVDSISILPAIHRYFNVIEEKPYGNNLLQSALKDIAHHFVNEDAEKKEILERVFDLEDEFLKTNKSDFVFGIYQLK